MDALGTYLTAEIIKALGEGNLMKFGAYVAIFLVLWLEMKGIKKEVAKLNGTIAKSFADGETRFKDIEHRLTVLEQKTI